MLVLVAQILLAGVTGAGLTRLVLGYENMRES